MRIKYGVHPSTELVDLFLKKPYQGQAPEKARVIVLGNDANYSEKISAHPFFKNILSYHRDGVAFWKKQGKHHPFLLDSYPFDRRLDGVKYHANFHKLGFSAEDADNFSFVELLNVPTIGNTDRSLFFSLLDAQHLRYLDDVVFSGTRKFVLINQTLAREAVRINRKFGLLGNLSKAVQASRQIGRILETPSVVVYNGYSFSHAVSNDYLLALSANIRAFLKVRASTLR